MKLHRLAVAARYAERHAIKEILMDAKLDLLPVQLMATWMTIAAESDGELTEQQAVDQAEQNCNEICAADALLYFPSWAHDRERTYPFWSPGRLIDFGIALASNVSIIVVGQPEPTIYQRGDLVTVCEPATLHDTIKQVLHL